MIDTDLDETAHAKIKALADRQANAAGLVLRAVTAVGGQVEDGLKSLPSAVQKQINQAALKALTKSYDMAAKSREGRFSAAVQSDAGHKALATLSGALGGVGGLPTALAELPIATTMIFRAIQGVAAHYDADPTSPDTRAECLAVFGAGGPGQADDGIDTAFVGARLSLSGAAVHTLIARVAPRFAAVISQKLASQAVPVLGAAAGAGTNYAFIGYYVELAHVHFGLRQLARTYGDTVVLDAFHTALARPAVKRAM